MRGRLTAWYVQRHNIGLLEKAIHINVRHVMSVGKYSIRFGVTGQNVQTESSCYLHDPLPDGAGADHSKGFALQVESL